MKTFYTFGRDPGYPYCGGWVKIEAPSLQEANATFRKFFPDKTPGILNCADYYTEEEFFKTDMPEHGNLGAGCYCKFHVCPECGVHYVFTDWRIK